MKRVFSGLLIFCLVAALFFAFAPGLLESSMNKVERQERAAPSAEAIALHKTLVVGDLHTDSTLWHRDLLERAERGHVDIPRLQEGNVALQVFTSVTKSPAGLNYEENSADSIDSITLLAISQRWPRATWSSLTARALYQGQRLAELEQRAPEQFKLIRNKADLAQLLAARAAGEQIVGGILGTEGSHALDGNLEAIDALFDAGFRTMGLQHFFDNRLGGSLHGQSGAGLTEFGKAAVDRMVASQVIIDVAHSSPAVVSDVLARVKTPLIVSHTGFYGHCQGPRNISDDLMKQIAAGGGLIGVGYWDAAVCATDVDNIVAAMRYGIDLVGVDHVALGSDFDGSVITPMDTSELVLLTDAMLGKEFTEEEIRKVMGGNLARFMAENLP
ncbi:MAG: membrane dipeptidase [Halieaceae bacterium]